MKQILISIAALVLCVLAVSAKDYSTYYSNLPVKMKPVTEPQIPERSVTLTDFNAKGDGVTLNTEAIKAAIAKLDAMGGGHLIVPEGIYLTAPFELKSNIDLHLERNAMLLATPDKSLHFPVVNGKRAKKTQSLVYAEKCHDISITGEGIIDGNGKYWRPVKRGKVSDVEWKDFLSLGGEVSEKGDVWYPFNLKHFGNITSAKEKEMTLRAKMVRFVDCKNVLLSGITLQNAPAFHFNPARCENMIIDGIRVLCPWNAQNGDGIDIRSSKDVLIVNNNVNVGDDGICMKSGIGEQGDKDGPNENILIENNTVNHAHGGFVIGSDCSGGTKNIVVRHNFFSSTDTGLRFKSSIGRGNYTKNIFISDIYMNNISTYAIVFECTYENKTVGYKGADNKTETAETPKYVPDFTDIHINNIVCRGAKTAISAHGLEGLNCVHGIDIKNSTFFYYDKDKDIAPEVDINIENCRFLTFE